MDEQSLTQQSTQTMTMDDGQHEQSTTITTDEVIAKGGVACPFPWRLHHMLSKVEEEGLTQIVSWLPHGRAFLVRDVKRFTKDIMPRFFGQSKYPSFQRQLNLYGFARFAHGTDKGAYYHLCFVRGHNRLVHQMVRRKVKGTKVRHTIKASDEPNFYDCAWTNHFLPTYPAEVLQKMETLKEAEEAKVVVTPPRSKKPALKTLADKSGGHFVPLPGDLIPTKFHKLPTKEQVNFLPRVSLTEDEPYDVVSFTHEKNPAPTFASSALAEADWTTEDYQTKDGELTFFEGIPFHFTDKEDPLLSAVEDPHRQSRNAWYEQPSIDSFANLTEV